MANTTNFGWETPDDTDLVKDGAAAMRTLGNAIDASLVDLKGGTTGQVLSKNTNTDMDFTWVTTNDADAIQNSIVDAKGDLISATADNTPARLASSGNNGDVLTVDTSTSTGLKWAAPASGSTFVGASAYRTSPNQTITNTTWTALTFNDEYWDTDAFHDNSTNNSRFTIPAGKAGKYLITVNVGFVDKVEYEMALAIYKNGSVLNSPGYIGFTEAKGAWAFGNIVVDAAVNDYFEVYIFISSNSNEDVDQSNAQISYLGA